MTALSAKAGAPTETAERSGKFGLRDLIAPVRARLTAGCIVAGVSATLTVGPAIAIAELARTLLTTPQDGARVWAWAAAGIVAAVLASMTSFVASQLCHYADADFRSITRRRIVHHLMTVPLGWFVSRGSGEVKKAIGDDVKRIHTLVAHAYADATAAAVGPIVACVYLFWNDWRLALLLLAFIAASLAVAVPRMSAGFSENMAAWENAQARLQAGAVETIEGIEVVKTSGTSSGVFARFAQEIEHLSRVAVRWMSAIGGPNTLLTNLFSSAGLMMWITASGVTLIALGRSDPATLVAFLAVGVGVPAGLMHLVQLGYAIREAQAATVHLRDVMETPPLRASSTPSEPAGGRVEFDQVDFCYEDGTAALVEVSATMEPGTITAVVGSSGSGKTTLARLIPRFWDVTAGRILIGGADVRDIPTDVLLSKVAFVFQETILLRDTVAANLLLARPDSSQEQMREAARAAGIHDRIEALPHGYETVLGEDGAGLSGGEQQRLAIARAVLQDAPIVVLDEATAHADPESEAEVQHALSALASGKTVIVIAHRLHTISHAHQILVLEAGRIAERGSHTELLAAGGSYAGLWRAQNLNENRGERP